MQFAMGPIWHDFRRCRYNVSRIKNIWSLYDMVWDIVDMEKEKEIVRWKLFGTVWMIRGLPECTGMVNLNSF